MMQMIFYSISNVIESQMDEMVFYFISVKSSEFQWMIACCLVKPWFRQRLNTNQIKIPIGNSNWEWFCLLLIWNRNSISFVQLLVNWIRVQKCSLSEFYPFKAFLEIPISNSQKILLCYSNRRVNHRLICRNDAVRY